MRIKLNHKGFSLVEILLGVTILAIITVPITHAFVTSARTSTKAQNIRSQTVAAQNVLEAYEATNIGEIFTAASANANPFENVGTLDSIQMMDDDGNYGSVADYTKTDGAGYIITLSDVQGPNVQGVPKTYDAKITVEANPGSDGEFTDTAGVDIRYQDINDELIVNAKPMSALTPYAEPLESPDVQVAKRITLDVQMDLLVKLQAMMAAAEEDESLNAAVAELQAEIDNLSYLDFIDTMERKITITLQKVDLGEGKIDVRCEALFEYDTEYKDKPYDGDFTVPFFCDDYQEGGNYGVFFFYYPNLNTAAGSDIIDIYNEANLELNVYLIRQNYENIPVEFPAYIPASNKPAVSLHETNRNWGLHDLAYASLYTNFAKDGDKYTYWITSTWKAPPQELPGTLGGQTSQNRIYKVTVDLYEKDMGYAEDALLLHMDASSVE